VLTRPPIGKTLQDGRMEPSRWQNQFGHNTHGSRRTGDGTS
jgi:hypothetical protein